MATINPTTPSDGETMDASDVTNPVNTITNEINGNLDSNNLANNAVTTAKITDAAVTPAKLAAHIKIGTFTTSANGQLSVTGVGFQPKYLEMRLVSSGDNTSSVLTQCSGFYDGTTQIGTGFRAGESADISGKVSSTQICWIPGANATQADIIVIDSFDSDGFTYTVSSYSTGRAFYWVAYG